MRIAVVADSHNRLLPGFTAQLQEADEIWHLGDVCREETLSRFQSIGRPMRVVRGNCDECPDWPLTCNFVLEGWRVQLIHIPPRRPPPATDLLFHGHTHVPRDETIGSTRYLNPGCLTRPNRGAPASFAWLEITPGKIEWRLKRLV